MNLRSTAFAAASLLAFCAAPPARAQSFPAAYVPPEEAGYAAEYRPGLPGLKEYSPAEDGEKVPALSFITGVPMLAYGSCSGAPVTAPGWPEPLFLTARHCFSASSVSNPMARGAYAGGRVFGIGNPGDKALDFYPARGQADLVQDFVLAPIKGQVHPKARVYKLAASMPPPGSPVKIWGYPKMGSDLVLAWAPLNSMECTYLGPFLGVGTGDAGRPFTILHAAKCPYKFFIKGMSGGPVVDAAGDVIGTLSMGTMSYRFKVDGVVELFPEVTQARVNPAPSAGGRDFLLPLPDGNRFYDPVNMFVPEPLPDFTADWPQKPAQPLILARGVMQVPLAGQVVHGLLRAYNPDGTPLDCARYEKGRFVGPAACD